MDALQIAIDRVREALGLVKAVQHIEGLERDHIEDLLEGAFKQLSTLSTTTG